MLKMLFNIIIFKNNAKNLTPSSSWTPCILVFSLRAWLSCIAWCISKFKIQLRLSFCTLDALRVFHWTKKRGFFRWYTFDAGQERYPRHLMRISHVSLHRSQGKKEETLTQAHMNIHIKLVTISFCFVAATKGAVNCNDYASSFLLSSTSHRASGLIAIWIHSGSLLSN